MFQSSARAGCGDPENGLVGWWKFDDGSGSTAIDSSGQGNNGTLTNSPTWTGGKIGTGALKFLSSTSQYVDVGNPSDLNFDRTQPFSISAWVDFSLDGVKNYIVSKEPNTGYFPGILFWIDGLNSRLQVQLVDSVGESISVNAQTSTLSAGAWHHVVMTYDGSSNATGVKIYVDGLSQALQTATGTLTSSILNSVDMTIGYNLAANSQNKFSGLIDDVRVYDRALSASEIKNLYNAGYAADLLFNGDERVLQYCDGHNWVAVGHPFAPMNGLVGWWKFDDGSGTSVVDSSGNNNTGTLTNSPTWVGGYVGTGALKFSSASAQYAKTAGNFQIASAANFTLSAWIDPLGGYGTVIGQHGNPNGELVLNAGGGTINLYYDGWISGTGYPMPPDGQWTHIAAVVSGSINLLYVNGALVASVNRADYSPDSSDPLYIGYSPNNNSYFNGLIDDVRVYNRALSATEVSNIYYATGGSATGDTTTGLVGWWKFDDGTGTSVTDSSGNGNNGSLTGSPSPTWTSGKIGGALSFNGSNNRVTIPPGLLGAGPATFSAWVYPFASSPSQTYFQDGSGGLICEQYGGPPSVFACTFSWSPVAYAPVYIQANQWQFLTAVLNGSGQVTFYVNGVQSGSANQNAGTPGTGTSSGAIGSDWTGGALYNGLIDDVRIYNRALSATDIAALYNARACANPTRWEGDIIYNGPYHVLQYCNGHNWIPAGPVPGPGGAGCANPSGVQGDFLFNHDKHVMQYCDGTNWITMGGLPAVPEGGLVGWWKFDDGSSGTTPTTAADSSGNNNTGTLVNSPVWTSSGKDGNALTFNPANHQYVQIANVINPAQISVSAWVKSNVTPSGGAVYEVYAANSANQGPGGETVALRFGDCANFPTTCAPAFWAAAPGYYKAYGGTALQANQWYFLVGTSDGTSAHLYINGIETTNSPSSPFASSLDTSNTFEVIGTHASYTNWFNGTIDDVRVYDRALSASEVWDLYLATGGT